MKENKGIKKWGFLFVLLMMCLLPSIRVNADSEQVLSLVGDDAISPGATISYKVDITSNDATVITGFSSPITYDSSVLTLAKMELGTGWSGKTVSVPTGNTISFTSEAGVTGNTTVATLIFKVNATATSNTAYITLSGATFNYKDGEGTAMKSLAPVTKNLKVKSSDNTLTGIKVNGKTIEEFSSDILEYNVNVESKIETVKIQATTHSSKATFKEGFGNREVPVNYGGNVVTIVVVSESGVEKTYTLNIVREDTRSTDTTLSSITVDGVVVPNFKSSTYKYTVKKYKAETVSIVGVTNDENATVVVTPPAKVVVGENTYILTVTSENGDTSTYTVVINNIDTAINKKLKTLSIQGYDIEFDKNNYRYEINYNKEKFDDLRIYFAPAGNSDEVKATLTPDINNDKEALKKLKPGDVLTIKIEGIDGETAEYTIVILKDNRISFYLVLELFIIFVFIIIVVVVSKKRKKEELKSGRKTTKNKDTKPKKKRFSIYEDDEEADLENTKELTTEELKTKK